ncbi:hypothetical protein RB601_008379 [Gaeumannomyces tritici]
MSPAQPDKLAFSGYQLAALDASILPHLTNPANLNSSQAPIRYVLDQLIRRGGGADCLDRVVDVLAKISHIFPEMEDYESLYSKHPAVRDILEDCCETIIKFNIELMEVFNKAGWRVMFESSWGRFKKNTADMASTLERNSKLLSEAKQTATMRMTHQNQELLERMTQKLEEIPQRTAATDREDARDAEQRLNQLRDVINKLAPAQYLDDQSDFQRRLYRSETKAWLLTDERFTAWADLDDEGHKVMDLNGCPGAGKSILVSSAVHHLQELQATPGQTPFSLAYFYFRHNTEDRTTFKHALQALISQLVTEESDGALLDHASQALSAVHKPSQTQLADLASTAIQAKRICFVVLDGLDECNDNDQSELVCWLKDQTTKGGDAPLTLRILLSGRREGRLDREISQLPSVLSVSVDKSARHHAGIRQYVEAKARHIRNTFGVGDRVERSITERVVPHAKGMFLFAFVMVEYLSGLDCAHDLEEELQSLDFPEGLDQAYERVARNVVPSDHELATSQGLKNVPSKGRRDRAKNLLSWISCAVRPLYWREAQARFMINPHAGPERLARKSMFAHSPKRLCGCLVDLTTVTSDGPKEAVQIVHRTASEYLERSRRIPSAGQQHVDMLTFCCQYLKSPAFSAPVPQTIREEHATTGYYAFQEYAAAYWHDHVMLLRQHAANLPPETVRPALDALSGFLTASFRAAQDGQDRTALHGLGPDSNLLDNVAGLNPEPSERNKLFLVQSWVSLTREAIEAARRGTRHLQDADLEKFYGPERFKCPRPWCDFFHLGFRKQSELEQHIDAHTRPFRCNVEGCEVSSLGFESKPTLDRHNERFHKPRSEDERFPKAVSSKGGHRAELARAIKEGNLIKVKELIGPQNLKVVFREDIHGEPMTAFTPLIHAIRCGQFKICKYLLESGAKVIYHQGRATDMTPLREAIRASDTALLDLLLNHIPEMEEPAPNHETLDTIASFLARGLELALALGNEGPALSLLKKFKLDFFSRSPGSARVCFYHIIRFYNMSHLFPLLQQHIPLSFARGNIVDGRSILSFAAEYDHPEIITSIIAEGDWDINERCPQWRTPLSYAAEKGNLATLRVILQVEGVELGASCIKRRSPHYYAASEGHLECLQTLYIATSSGIYGSDIFCQELRHYATNAGKESLEALSEILLTLAEWAGHSGKTMHHHAVINGRPECLKVLFDIFPTGSTEMHTDGNTLYLHAVINGRPECLKTLSDVFPTGIEQIDADGNTLYHHAVINGRPGCLKALFEIFPTGIEQINADGNTLYHHAVINGRPECLKALFEIFPTGLEWMDAGGNTPYHIAAAKGDLESLKALLEILPTGDRLKDQNGKSPLFIAVENLKLDCVRCLLALPEGDVEATCIDDTGNSALSSLDSRSIRPREVAAVAEIARLLLERMPSLLDLSDRDGWCPMHNFVSIQNFEPEALNWVTRLAHTANPNRTTFTSRGDVPRGVTALEIAIHRLSRVTSTHQKVMLGIVEAIIHTGNFEFSAFDRERRRSLLLGIPFWQPRPTNLTLLVSLFHHGFRPFLADVFALDSLLVPWLLMAVDNLLTKTYLEEAECLEMVELATCTGRDDAIARKAYLFERHRALGFALQKAINGDDSTQPNPNLFPSCQGEDIAKVRGYIPVLY